MKLKRGYVSPVTGLVFCGYGKSYANGEWWTSKEVYDARNERCRLAALEKYKDENHRAVILERNKKWRSGKGKEWSSLRDNNPVVRSKKLESFKKSYAENETFRKAQLEKSKGFRSSPSGKEWERRYKGLPKSLERRRRRDSKRKQDDPAYAVKFRIRNRLARIIAVRGINTSRTLTTFSGASVATIRKFIEDQFQDGMTWGNRDLWHVDHFFPIGLARTESDLFIFSHFSNLRPLWSADNLKKQDTPPTPAQMIERDSFIENWIKTNQMAT